MKIAMGKNTLLVGASILALVAVAAFVHVRTRPLVLEPAPQQPFTPEEAEAMPVDTSAWKTFRSTDGILEFRYPERMEVWIHPDVGTEAYWGPPSTSHHVGTRGKYMASEWASRATSVPSREPEMSFDVRLHDKSADLNVLLAAEKKNADRPSETSSMVIGGNAYLVTAYEKWNDGERVTSYFRELADGRILRAYVQAYGHGADAEPSRMLADHVMREIIASIRVK